MIFLERLTLVPVFAAFLLAAFETQADESVAQVDAASQENTPSENENIPPAPSAEQEIEPEKTTAVIDETPSVEAPQAVVENKESKKSWNEVVSVKGDFRYRLELIDIDDTEETRIRHRHRIRGRLGAYADLPQGLTAGIGLATGSTDPVSTNQTLSDAFASKPVWLDLAYAGWHPDYAKGLFIEAGKIKNPFLRIGGSELIFDSDVTPEGATLGFSRAFGIAEPFFNSAAFFVQERSSADDSWLLGIQGGIKLTIKDDLIHIIAGLTYYDHTRIKGKPTYYDIEDSFGNSVDEVLTDPDDPESLAIRYRNDYNLIEGFFELGGTIVKFPWSVFFNLVYNAAADDDNLGWLLGASFGKCKNPLDFSVNYFYEHLEADATVGAFTNSDFIGGGTDGKGHRWSIDFQAAKALQLGVTYFFNKIPIENGENYHRGQFDFKVKF